MNCPLCLAKSFLEESFFYRCERCDLSFKAPDKRPSYESEKQRYLSHNNDTEDEVYLGYLDKLLSFVDLDSIKSVLDYGCGPTKGLKALMAKKDLQICVDSYDPIFFPDGVKKTSYDLIYASECFEHFYNPKKEIEKIISCLSVGGGLAVSTNLSDGADLKTWWYAKDPTHVVFYSKKTIEFLAKNYGLELSVLQSPHIVLTKA